MKTRAWRKLILMALMFSAAFVTVMVGQTLAERQDPKRAKEFMRQKLSYSQNIIEGLALENYELIITNGIKMFNMSQSTHWQVRSSSEYKKYSAAYSDRVAAMIDAAREKRIDAARDAYCKSLQGCYDCHRYCQRVPAAVPKPNASK